MDQNLHANMEGFRRASHILYTKQFQLTTYVRSYVHMYVHTF